MSRVVENQAAYILHRRLYGESSYLLDVFTLNYGRMSLIAKGAAKGKKNQSALLQVFQPLNINWTGRSSLKTLVNAEAPTKAIALSSRFLYCGFYVNELILKLCPEMEANTDLFANYVDTLVNLNDHGNIEAVLRHFEHQLLVLLGHAPDFSCTAKGLPVQASQNYFLTANEGFIEQIEVQDNQYETESKLISGIEGATLLRLTQGWFLEQRSIKEVGTEYKNTFREAKVLMRRLIDDALQGQTLKSRELFKQLVRGK